MSSTPSNDAVPPDTTPPASPAHAPAPLVVSLPSLAPDVLESVLDKLSTAFAAEEMAVATPDELPMTEHAGMELIALDDKRVTGEWVLTSGDYAAAAQVALAHGAEAILLLSGEVFSLSADVLHSMVDSVRKQEIDLVLPRFSLGVEGGLVNSALLYPLTRALFAADIRFPLPADAALSPRMLQRLEATQRATRVGQSSAFLWPVAEAAIAGYSIREVDAGAASPPQPDDDDFNALFQSVVGSLFADIEAKASFWQRARSRMAVAPEAVTPLPPGASVNEEIGAETQHMIEAFHLAHANLQEIWSLVLPPQSRLALKKLSLSSANAFFFDPNLWARIVYDFTLAFHLRTLNRSHLLGALTPLYLAWAASHLHAACKDLEQASRHIRMTATGFEVEKSYLVSRWRWPDRFNP